MIATMYINDVINIIVIYGMNNTISGRIPKINKNIISVNRWNKINL